jgi:hypothetical protein
VTIPASRIGGIGAAAAREAYAKVFPSKATADMVSTASGLREVNPIANAGTYLERLAAGFVVQDLPVTATFDERQAWLTHWSLMAQATLETMSIGGYVPDDTDALVQTNRVNKELERKSESWFSWSAVSEYLPVEQALSISAKVLIDFLWVAQKVAAAGMGAHTATGRAMLGPFMTQEQLELDYYLRLGLLQGVFVFMPVANDLRAMYEAERGGMGAAPIVAVPAAAAGVSVTMQILLTVGAVAGIAVLAAVALSMYQVYQTNITLRDAADQCAAADTTNEYCVAVAATIDEAGKAATTDPASAATNTVIKYAVVAGLIYLGIMLSPQIIDRLGQASDRATARRSPR